MREPAFEIREATRLFRLASHPLRLRMLLLLDEGACDTNGLRCVAEGDSPEAVRAHLQALCSGSLVRRQLVGRGKVYRLTEVGQRVLRAYRSIVDRAILAPAAEPGPAQPEPLPRRNRGGVSASRPGRPHIG